jgi:hypothetical protein
MLLRIVSAEIDSTITPEAILQLLPVSPNGEAV